ncbi:TPA: biopolymer transporter ExbD [Candidatus Scatousia excrementigallinarum]|uniref:Biopolymer transporter ExbD n=1 Tax=Candidatus Scatousia excrementigallinarum TaxID=2840935 RepID=A0A9D1EXY6_9BACT|nr:biopolymer transporter ExbD [Candidatus Scatousia excrementigallinarum]
MGRERDTFNEINITPLTDIFLVLLIIMMVIAPLLDQQGLNLTVPENVAEEQVQKDTKVLTVDVSSDNRYFIDGQEVSAGALEKTLKAQSKDFPDGLMIQTDGNATHGAVVKLMDSARNSGFTSISVSEV